jgi:class 3 adenylate cyclase
VTAGVVGGRRPQYDLWGQCVTLASRLEASSLPDHLQVNSNYRNIVEHLICGYCILGLFCSI